MDFAKKDAQVSDRNHSRGHLNAVRSLGVRLGRPSLFFYVAAAAGLVQLALVSRLKRMPKGEIPDAAAAAAVKQKTI